MLTDPLKRKQLKKGLEQLSEEGAVQVFYDRARLERDPILGAVGQLQFDLVKHRLKGEYNVNADFGWCLSHSQLSRVSRKPAMLGFVRR